MSEAMHPAIAPTRVAVITGAASGIGLAAAYRFGRAGMRIVAADNSDHALEEAAQDLRKAGVKVRAVSTDVSDKEAVAALAAQARDFGEVSLLMNNAGCEGGGGILDGPAIWGHTLFTNLFGPLYGIQAFLPGMLTAGWPCAIVNTGSKQGITLPPGDTAYNVSKARLKALTESLSHDLLRTNGRVTAHLLIPGFTFTGFTRAQGITEKPAGAWTSEQVVDFMMTAMAQGDFYILCPDNDVNRRMDERRIAWAAEDIIQNRPALSRWHPRYSRLFEAWMESDTA